MKRTRYEVEYDVHKIVEDLMYEHNLESDFYGDCYPSEVMELENKMERCKSEEEYAYSLVEIKEIFESYI